MLETVTRVNSMRDSPRQVHDSDGNQNAVLRDLQAVRAAALTPGLTESVRAVHVETLFLAASAAVQRLLDLSGSSSDGTSGPTGREL